MSEGTGESPNLVQTMVPFACPLVALYLLTKRPCGWPLLAHVKPRACPLLAHANPMFACYLPQCGPISHSVCLQSLPASQQPSMSAGIGESPNMVKSFDSKQWHPLLAL